MPLRCTLDNVEFCNFSKAFGLWKLHKKIYLVVNKIDKVQKDIVLSEFSELGFDDVTLISGKNGSGIKEITKKIADNVTEAIKAENDEDLNLDDWKLIRNCWQNSFQLSI